MRTLPLALVALVAATLALPALAERPSSPGPVFAQAPDGSPRGPGRRGRRGRLSPEERQRIEQEVRRKMETYLTVELSSQLGLDEKKALQLAEVIKRQGDKKETAHEQMRAEMQALRDLVEKKASDAALKAQMKKVADVRKAREDLDGLLADTAKFLTPTEQAKLMLAFPRVMKDMRHMMRAARRDHRRGGGPPMPPGLEDDE